MSYPNVRYANWDTSQYPAGSSNVPSTTHAQTQYSATSGNEYTQTLHFITSFLKPHVGQVQHLISVRLVSQASQEILKRIPVFRYPVRISEESTQVDFRSAINPRYDPNATANAVDWTQIYMDLFGAVCGPAPPDPTVNNIMSPRYSSHGGDSGPQYSMVASLPRAAFSQQPALIARWNQAQEESSAYIRFRVAKLSTKVVKGADGKYRSHTSLDATHPLVEMCPRAVEIHTHLPRQMTPASASCVEAEYDELTDLFTADSTVLQGKYCRNIYELQGNPMFEADSNPVYELEGSSSRTTSTDHRDGTGRTDGRHGRGGGGTSRITRFFFGS